MIRFLAAILIAGFAFTAPAYAQRTRGDTDVRVVRNIGMPEYIDMANEVTNSLLQSPRFADLSARSEQAKIVLGIPTNNTRLWNIQAEDIFDTVRNTLVNSGLVRVFGTGYTDVDYVLNSEFTTTRTEGRREYVMTYTLTLTTLEGEFIGAWSSHRAYVQ